jgi:hypothetical protein
MSYHIPLQTLSPNYKDPVVINEQITVTETIEPCPCAKEEPCIDKCGNLVVPTDGRGGELGYEWGWFGALILWFIIFTVLFWLIYYSLKPPFVLQNDSNQVDTAKVLFYAVISAAILVFIVWLIKFAVSKEI